MSFKSTDSENSLENPQQNEGPKVLEVEAQVSSDCGITPVEESSSVAIVAAEEYSSSASSASCKSGSEN